MTPRNERILKLAESIEVEVARFRALNTSTRQAAHGFAEKLEQFGQIGALMRLAVQASPDRDGEGHGPHDSTLDTLAEALPVVRSMIDDLLKRQAKKPHLN